MTMNCTFAKKTSFIGENCQPMYFLPKEVSLKESLKSYIGKLECYKPREFPFPFLKNCPLLKAFCPCFELHFQHSDVLALLLCFRPYFCGKFCSPCSVHHERQPRSATFIILDL